MIMILSMQRYPKHMHNYIDYNLKQRMDGYRRYDVGVDANNYYPVSLDDIKDFFICDYMW